MGMDTIKSTPVHTIMRSLNVQYEWNMLTTLCVPISVQQHCSVRVCRADPELGHYRLDIRIEDVNSISMYAIKTKIDAHINLRYMGN